MIETFDRGTLIAKMTACQGSMRAAADKIDDVLAKIGTAELAGAGEEVLKTTAWAMEPLGVAITAFADILGTLVDAKGLTSDGSTDQNASDV